MKSIGNRILGGALAAWLLALASCGTAPTAPQPDVGGIATGGGQASSARPGGATRGGLLGELLEPAEGPGRVVAPVQNIPSLIGEDGLELVEPVAGNTGATLHVADIKVTVPPGAFSGNAQIKLTIPDSTKLECHLDIYPASLNHFEVPVRLEFNVRKAGDPRMMVVFWFDEQAQGWVPITTTTDVVTGKIWADLPHFSMYKADDEVKGRAGW